MTPLRTLRTLTRSVERLDALAAESADDVTLTASAVRSAAYDVAGAGRAVETMAQVVTGLAIALAGGWAIGTLLRSILDQFKVSDDDA